MKPIASDAHVPVGEVTIRAGRSMLRGDLALPARAVGLVLFAHGSGSGRHSPRNRLVAEHLQQGGLGTLLLDLLTEKEAAADQYTARHRFDIDLLAERVGFAANWLAGETGTADLPYGYFGASTGAAAALVAAAANPGLVRAVVSRGGRPDLAADALPHVLAPTLLIVGGEDFEVIRLNREAFARLRCPKQLEIVPAATHLFEEPGTLEEVSRLARAWFLEHLAARSVKPEASRRDRRRPRPARAWR